MSGATDSDIENLIDAAGMSGAVDPEQEIAALQDLLRTAWGLMTEAQQTALMESDEAQELLASEEDESGEEEE